MYRLRILPGLLSLLLSVSASQLADARTQEPSSIKLLASIQPVGLIANDLLAGLGEVAIQVPPGASPHDFALRVSDRQKIQQAELVIWMGPSLERFLTKTLNSLPEERVLALGQSESEPHTDDRRHHGHGPDLHQWLDPEYAIEMARAIAERLVQLYPGRSNDIQQRFAALSARYADLDHTLEERFAKVKEQSFVVQHRGYGYLVAAYGLTQLDWISLSPEQSPGVRHLYDLEKRLRELPAGEQARCLFVETGHESATARSFARQLGLEVQALDILGLGAESYSDLMEQLANDMVSCLSGR
ncbi:zinc ABC transporter substrate-binding protein [Gilvimarinus sp. F26214L]|uniref:zinc ABC transporter substrate-binding protein n=1 Tax=Gilvimarinus sp. DZF01 TaxID=3461371 RepID=UPI0040466C9B